MVGIRSSQCHVSVVFVTLGKEERRGNVLPLPSLIKGWRVTPETGEENRFLVGTVGHGSVLLSASISSVGEQSTDVEDT